MHELGKTSWDEFAHEVWSQILSGIQFTKHFIKFFVVETKRFVGNVSNVILTRQTCGQHSSRAAESKRRALGNYFCERICYIFLISKCRGDRVLVLCNFWGTCKKRTAAQCQIPIFPAGETRFFPEVAIAQRFSVRKYPKIASTQKLRRPTGDQY